ncbi:MAG: helix-turn-helix domain-containing protein [Paracoccus sp. (in: a-proteobacteria)]|nr:helix-turn-helix domain-containing protein [Paracoccus sp. (in: a-proteobacteria)]
MADFPRPPAHLEPYVNILGLEDAVTFLMHFGGGELYLARRVSEDSPVAELIGRDAAEALGQAADRLPRRVPTGKPWLAEVFRSQGLSATQIARRLHSSDVTVRRWLKQADERRSAARQIPLI